jgi:hypothetical protein
MIAWVAVSCPPAPTPPPLPTRSSLSIPSHALPSTHTPPLHHLAGVDLRAPLGGSRPAYAPAAQPANYRFADVPAFSNLAASILWAFTLDLDATADFRLLYNSGVLQLLHSLAGVLDVARGAEWLLSRCVAACEVVWLCARMCAWWRVGRGGAVESLHVHVVASASHLLLPLHNSFSPSTKQSSAPPPVLVA